MNNHCASCLLLLCKSTVFLVCDNQHHQPFSAQHGVWRGRADLLRVPRLLQPSPPAALRPQLLPHLHTRGLEHPGRGESSLHLPAVSGGAWRGAVRLLPFWYRGRTATVSRQDLPEVWSVTVCPTPSAPSGEAGVSHTPVGGSTYGPLPETMSNTHGNITLLLCRRKSVRLWRLSAGRRSRWAQSEGAETGGGGSEGQANTLCTCLIVCLFALHVGFSCVSVSAGHSPNTAQEIRR